MKILLAAIVLFSGISFADPNSLPQRNLESENKILTTKLKAAQKEIESLQAENKKLKALLKFNNIETKNNRKGSVSGILPKMQVGYQFKMTADQSLVVSAKASNSELVCEVETISPDNAEPQFVFISNCTANIAESATTGQTLPKGIIWQVTGTKTISIAKDGVLVKETVYAITQVR